MTDRQEAAARLLTQDRFRPEYEADVRLLLTPPLPSEIQEALDAVSEDIYRSTQREALATITTALSTASETEAAFIELMEADDLLDMKQVLNAWRTRQALKDAHKARYDALISRNNSEKE